MQNNDYQPIRKNCGIIGEVNNYYVAKLIGDKIDPTKYTINFDELGRITSLINKNNKYFEESTSYTIFYLEEDKIEIVKEKAFYMPGAVNKIATTYNSSGEAIKVVEYTVNTGRKESVYENGKRIKQVLYDSYDNYICGSLIPEGEMGSPEYIAMLLKLNIDFLEYSAVYDKQGRVVKLEGGNRTQAGEYNWGIQYSVNYSEENDISITEIPMGLKIPSIKTWLFNKDKKLVRLVEKSSQNKKDWILKITSYNEDGGFSVVIMDKNTNVISRKLYNADGYDDDGYDQNGKKRTDNQKEELIGKNDN